MHIFQHVLGYVVVSYKPLVESGVFAVKLCLLNLPGCRLIVIVCTPSYGCYRI